MLWYGSTEASRPKNKRWVRIQVVFVLAREIVRGLDRIIGLPDCHIDREVPLLPERNIPKSSQVSTVSLLAIATPCLLDIYSTLKFTPITMHFSLPSLLTSFLILTPGLASTHARPRASPGLVKRELLSYEERYINTRSYVHPNTTLKLIGCKKMKIPSSEVEDFENHYYENYDEMQKFESHFYDEANRELRIYFPVENALVQHRGSLLEASELGEFEMEGLEGDYAVVGRYQTDRKFVELLVSLQPYHLTPSSHNGDLSRIPPQTH
jgi:hypothetical protein